MTSFKFKAWHKKEKRMFKVAGISWWDQLIFESYDDIRSRELYHNMDDCILLLYTGHFDKNRKEICQADLVYMTDVCSDLLGDMLYVVTWEDAAFLLKSVENAYHYESFNWGSLINDSAEVVGNIYENPELVAENTRGGEHCA